MVTSQPATSYCQDKISVYSGGGGSKYSTVEGSDNVYNETSQMKYKRAAMQDVSSVRVYRRISGVHRVIRSLSVEGSHVVSKTKSLPAVPVFPTRKSHGYFLRLFSWAGKELGSVHTAGMDHSGRFQLTNRMDQPSYKQVLHIRLINRSVLGAL